MNADNLIDSQEDGAINFKKYKCNLDSCLGGNKQSAFTFDTHTRI